MKAWPSICVIGDFETVDATNALAREEVQQEVAYTTSCRPMNEDPGSGCPLNFLLIASMRERQRSER
jgi:hypothetical protein